MKYYFIAEDGTETKFSLIDHSFQGRVGKYVFDQGGNIISFWVRNLAGKFFISRDQVSWTKIAKIGKLDHYVFANHTYKFFPGFKPSGMNKTQAGDLVTQMPGKIIKVNVVTGDKVKTGDTLIVLEAMKMENEIKASISGIVKSLNVKQGQSVESGVLMLEIEQSAD